MNQKYVFWQALVFTVIVFGLGLILGFFLERFRADKIELNLIDAETNILDEQLREGAISSFNVSCSLARNSTFRFADKIYFEASELEKYDTSSTLTSGLAVLHRRYDLLRLLLWTQSIKLRQECKKDFHTFVYLYNFDENNVNERAMEDYYERLLLEVKSKYADKVLLIPIAVDTDLESVRLVVEEYNIIDLPTILIDESSKINGVVSIQELESYISQSNKE